MKKHFPLLCVSALFAVSARATDEGTVIPEIQSEIQKVVISVPEVAAVVPSAQMEAQSVNSEVKVSVIDHISSWINEQVAVAHATASTLVAKASETAMNVSKQTAAKYDDAQQYLAQHSTQKNALIAAGTIVATTSVLYVLYKAFCPASKKSRCCKK